MKNKKWYLFLLITSFMQIILFNNLTILSLNFNILWIVFILVAFRLDRASLIPAGAFLGWLEATAFSNDSLSGVTYGLIISALTYWLCSVPYWSLAWVRAVVALLVVLLTQLGLAFFHHIDISLSLLIMLSLFTVVYVTISMGLAYVIKEPTYE